jgi:hypothetical protein
LHEKNSYEVACNLLNPTVTTADFVLEKALEKSAELKLIIVDSYKTGPTEDELVETLKSRVLK